MSRALVRAFTSLGEVPKTMGPRDRVFFSCTTNTTRSCQSSFTLSLEELDGPAGRHLVEINVESHRLWRFRLPVPYYRRIPTNAGSSSIMRIFATFVPSFKLRRSVAEHYLCKHSLQQAGQGGLDLRAQAPLPPQAGWLYAKDDHLFRQDIERLRQA